MIQRRFTGFFLILCLFLFAVGVPFFAQTEDEVVRQFRLACTDYGGGKYDYAARRLNRLIGIITEKEINRRDILGGCYLLLGAVHEKNNRPQQAAPLYRKARETYGITLVEGIDLEPLSLYRKIVKGEQEPAPQPSSAGTIEKVALKKRKKFPWLWVAGGTVLVGTVLVLLLTSKKDDSEDFDTGTLGIEWVDIPAGEFQMGDFNNEGGAHERPVHTVYLDTFKISRYEITYNQYDMFCDETGRAKPDDFGWGRDTRPAAGVSWTDADAFCRWLSSKSGKNITLPTEAQWEKAARGTDQRTFPWGDAEPDCNLANHNNCVGRTMPVGSYASGVSFYGVHDLAGNAWEWCGDWYAADYYSNSPAQNPTGPSSGTYRVHRGGGYNSAPSSMRCSNRDGAPPDHTSRRSGFRICLR